SLSSSILIEALAQRLHISAGTGCDGVENISDGGEACFDPGAEWVHASLHYTAHTRNQIDRRCDSDDAGGGPDHVNHVIGATTGPDRVPVRIERSHRNRNARFQPKLFGPVIRERSRDLVGSSVFAVQLFAHTGKKRIYLDQELLRRKPSQGPVPEPFVAHGAVAAFYFFM